MRKGKSDSKRSALFEPEFIEDLTFWVSTDRKIALKVFKLIDEVLRDPFRGIGKPEPLKADLTGCWSRRITQQHRLVYAVEESSIRFLQCRFHY